MKRIPVSGPWVTEREIDYVADAARHAWFDRANEFNQRFEQTFAELIGCRNAVSLPSCTSAIHLSLLAAGIGPGDEVIVPDVTWIASAAPVNYVGATPVFADIDPVTWCLDAASAAACITDRTRAILPVDLYGSMPDFAALRALAEQHDLFLLEDSAEAFGSTLKGRMAGSFGDTGVFSFHGSKTMTTGEGGMLVTDDDTLFKRILFLRDHGRIPGDTSFRNTEVAYKYKMSSLQAAFGLAQAERTPELIARKRAIFARYKQQLEGINGLTLNAEIDQGENSFWMVTAIVDADLEVDKFTLIDRMSDCNVDCRPFFSPLSSLEAYTDLPGVEHYAKQNPVSYDISNRGINLPSGYKLSDDEIDYCCQSLLRSTGLNG